MKEGDEVIVQYQNRAGHGYSHTHDYSQYAGKKGFYMGPDPSSSASWVHIGIEAVCLWDHDLRPAAPLSPFEAKVRAYIDKELR